MQFLWAFRSNPLAPRGLFALRATLFLYYAQRKIYRYVENIYIKERRKRATNTKFLFFELGRNSGLARIPE
jgi:hypothetical protein